MVCKLDQLLSRYFALKFGIVKIVLLTVYHGINYGNQLSEYYGVFCDIFSEHD